MYGRIKMLYNTSNMIVLEFLIQRGRVTVALNRIIDLFQTVKIIVIVGSELSKRVLIRLKCGCYSKRLAIP